MIKLFPSKGESPAPLLELADCVSLSNNALFTFFLEVLGDGESGVDMLGADLFLAQFGSLVSCRLDTVAGAWILPDSALLWPRKSPIWT